MQGAGVPVVGNPPTAAPRGTLHGSSTVWARRFNNAFVLSVFTASSTLPCNFIGSPGSGQCGVVENVSLSEAQVSKTAGDGLPLDTGATNSVNSRQIKASEFSVVPSTAPAFAGTATVTLP